MSAPAEATGDPPHRGSGVLRRSMRLGRTRVGIALTALVVIVALLGPVVAPHSPSDFVGLPLAPPTDQALLGTDYLGQDVLSRLLWGGRSVLWIATMATALGMFIGVSVGLTAAYSRSVLDEVLMRSTDLLLAFPQIVLVLLFVSLIGPKLWLIVLLVALAWAPQVARVARGATLEVVGREYVESAEVIGVARWRILLREVLPNVASPLLVEFGVRLTWSIALVAGISFLGFGIQPPNADWGLMINENRQGITLQPWAVLAPVACIALFTVGTNLITDGIARTNAGIDRAGGGR